MASFFQLIYPLQAGEGRRLFFTSWAEGFWTHLLTPAAPHSQSTSSSSSSSSHGSSRLPPGEEWPSTLETLRVLAVCSLRRSGCLHDYRGHLDQLQRGFTVLQGLAQIQDLRVRGRGKKNKLKTDLYREATGFLYCCSELTCPLITATCLWNCPLSKPGSFCGTQSTKV